MFTAAILFRPWMLAACLAAVAASADDPALVAPPVRTAPGPEYADRTRIFQGIPGIERAANGRLWALWYAGGPDEPSEGPGNYVVLVTSRDDGRTWSGPKVVIDPPGPVRAYDPCLWHDPQGRLWLFWAQSYQWWDGRSGVWAITCENSADENPRWSPPRRLADGIMMNKPTVLSTGDWLLPAAIWGRPAVPDTDPAHRHDLTARSGAYVIASTDQGRTWTPRGRAVVPERVFDEHMVVERRDGSLWMLVRTSYGIGESVSTDRGKTWSPGRPSGMPHVNSRFFIHRLSSGRLLLVTHNSPDKKTRSHLTAHLSDDDGRCWQGGLMIDERPGVSYPDGVQGTDGTVYLIYDYQRTGDKQILMATFTEDDVARGRWAPPKARQRVVVNQATGKRPSPADVELDARFQKWKAGLSPEQQAWEETLDENLGSFYLPLYKRGRVAGQVSAWDYVKDAPRLPRVLLIGDSISRGYTLEVRQRLAGKANLHRAPENCGGTANALKKLDIWLAGSKWDVIHFNFGIHDRRTPPDEYRRRLEQIVARLQKTGARLVWASTTPVAPGVKDISDAELVQRNRIAAEVMQQHGVAVNDLYTHILPDLAKYQNPKDCHFKGEGYQRLGAKVAETIAPLLADGRNK